MFPFFMISTITSFSETVVAIRFNFPDNVQSWIRPLPWIPGKYDRRRHPVPEDLFQVDTSLESDSARVAQPRFRQGWGGGDLRLFSTLFCFLYIIDVLNWGHFILHNCYVWILLRVILLWNLLKKVWIICSCNYLYFNMLMFVYF